MAQALKASDQALTILAESSGGLSADGPVAPGALELMNAGALEGLTLATGTIRMVQRSLEERGDQVDPKLLRIGNDVALGLLRLVVRVQEGALQARRDDRLERMLAAIEAEPIEGAG